MKIIVPMAGMGKRMRPHTLTTPKPLIPIAGKPIVQRLVEDIAKLCSQPITEVAFIIGDFGAETEKNLIAIAESLGAKGSIYYQEEPLGTAHAIYCAEASLSGPVVVAFADTLFSADFTLDPSADGVIWVQKIDDPSPFGVVKLNTDNVITDFVEKPKDYVSDLAIIGIYYFGSGETLRSEIKYLLDNDIKDKGEYQLTNALENMKNKGMKFMAGEVKEWLDCGNKEITVQTNTRMLQILEGQEKLIADDVVLNNAHIIQPCYIGSGVVLENSIVGPHVSMGAGTKVSHSVVSNSIIQTNVKIENSRVDNSLIGHFAQVKSTAKDLSMSDYTVVNI